MKFIRIMRKIATGNDQLFGVPNVHEIPRKLH